MTTVGTTTDFDRLLEQEALIEDAAELVSELMAQSGLTQKELAGRIGKSKGFVSQVLSGRRNMTLRTLSDMVGALGFRVALDATRLEAARRYRTTSSSGCIFDARRPLRMQHLATDETEGSLYNMMFQSIAGSAPYSPYCGHQDDSSGGAASSARRGRMRGRSAADYQRLAG